MNNQDHRSEWLDEILAKYKNGTINPDSRKWVVDSDNDHRLAKQAIQAELSKAEMRGELKGQLQQARLAKKEVDEHYQDTKHFYDRDHALNVLSHGFLGTIHRLEREAELLKMEGE